MARAFGSVGRVLLTVGVLILLFVTYQLWGTGIYAARAQDELANDFATTLSGAPSTSTTSTSAPKATTPTTSTTTEPAPLPPEGDAIARIQIPKIGLDDIVVNGTSRDDLRKAPGHFPETPFPGQVGNSAIAGHRTTYSAPFGDLDQLIRGDRITIQTVEGTFDYEVVDQRIVEPTDVAVLDPETDPNDPAKQLATLTLTTCHPKYSAAQRLVVKAQLDPKVVALPAPPLPPTATVQQAGLSGEDGSKAPVILAGLVAALIGALWWLGFHRHASWRTWLVGAVPFAVVLFIFYVYLERVLPSNY